MREALGSIPAPKKKRQKKKKNLSPKKTSFQKGTKIYTCRSKATHTHFYLGASL
jgi:hypothetical protein